MPFVDSIYQFLQLYYMAARLRLVFTLQAVVCVWAATMFSCSNLPFIAASFDEVQEAYHLAGGITHCEAHVPQQRGRLLSLSSFYASRTLRRPNLEFAFVFGLAEINIVARKRTGTAANLECRLGFPSKCCALRSLYDLSKRRVGGLMKK